MLGIPLGLIYGNAAEWFIHKHVLHGLGKNKKSMWKFHWHDHHKNARQNEMIDKDYLKNSGFLSGHTSKELTALLFACSTHLPLLPIFPFFTMTTFYCAYNYYRVHKKTHVDVEWCKKNAPWHYDHHMAPNQDANWCVTRPWFDILMKTRKAYFGTEIEKSAEQKKRLRKNKVRTIRSRKIRTEAMA